MSSSDKRWWKVIWATFLFLLRGALKYHMKSYELAIRDLTQATRIDNQCALAYFNRAVCFYEFGNVAKVKFLSGIFRCLLSVTFQMKIKADSESDFAHFCKWGVFLHCSPVLLLSAGLTRLQRCASIGWKAEPESARKQRFGVLRTERLRECSLWLCSRQPVRFTKQEDLSHSGPLFPQVSVHCSLFFHQYWGPSVRVRTKHAFFVWLQGNSDNIYFPGWTDWKKRWKSSPRPSSWTANS